MDLVLQCATTLIAPCHTVPNDHVRARGTNRESALRLSALDKLTATFDPVFNARHKIKDWLEESA